MFLAQKRRQIKLKVQQPKAKKAKMDTRKAKKTKNVSTDLWKIDNVQCMMDFGRNHHWEWIGSSIPSAKTGCTKSAVAL